MSDLNARRHGRDLPIRDHDLLTGRDCRRLIDAALSEFIEAFGEERRLEREAAATAQAAFNALPWWKRAWRTLAFRQEALR